ncbi:MAG: response regulator [archaeon]
MKPTVLKKSQVKKGRPKVLFVDDDPAIHKYTSRISKNLGLLKRTAFHPFKANSIIWVRLHAIARLKKKLIFKEKNAKSVEEKQDLLKRINTLNMLQKKPFALVVSDVNMPRRHAVGIKFVQDLRKNLPEQPILMHSDDLNSLDYLMEKGFAREIKVPGSNGEKLKERLKSELWPKKYPKKSTDDDWF